MLTRDPVGPWPGGGYRPRHGRARVTCAGTLARPAERDRPWVMRTYAGHSAPRRVERAVPAQPRQGADRPVGRLRPAHPDRLRPRPRAGPRRGRQGRRAGRAPRRHAGACSTASRCTQMNTSMTINATAMWLLALYQVARAEEQGADPAAADRAPPRTTSSRSTCRAAPTCSRRRRRLRLITDMVAYTVATIPQWNPINICSYHLQEAGATPVQEIAYALCTAIAVLDAVRDAGQVPPERFGEVVAADLVLRQRRRALRRGDVQDARLRRSSGTRSPASATASPTPKQRRFRYGVQVNSLGLTEAQPENNVQRIVLEMLGVTLSKDARARAVQLPAWNEALGLPRPWDQQWSLRMQQVLAFESDLLEYDDLFEGSTGGRGQGRASSSPAPAPRWPRVAGHGRRGRRRRERLHEVRAGRLARRAAGPDRGRGRRRRRRQRVHHHRAQPADGRPGGLDPAVDAAVEAAAVAAVRAWRVERDGDPARHAAWSAALQQLRDDARGAAT